MVFRAKTLKTLDGILKKKRCISIAVVKKYTEVRLEKDPIGCPFVGRKSHLDGKLLPSPIRVPTAVVFMLPLKLVEVRVKLCST